MFSCCWLVMQEFSIQSLVFTCWFYPWHKTAWVFFCSPHIPRLMANQEHWKKGQRSLMLKTALQSQSVWQDWINIRNQSLSYLCLSFQAKKQKMFWIALNETMSLWSNVCYTERDRRPGELSQKTGSQFLSFESNHKNVFPLAVNIYVGSRHLDSFLEYLFKFCKILIAFFIKIK